MRNITTLITMTRTAALYLVFLFLPACTLQREINKEHSQTTERDQKSQQINANVTDLTKTNSLENTHRKTTEVGDSNFTFPGQKINAQASLKELSNGSKTVTNPDGSSIRLTYDATTKTISAAADIPPTTKNVKINKTTDETTQKNTTQNNDLKTNLAETNQEQKDRAIKTETKGKLTKNANIALYIVVAASVLIFLLFLFLWWKKKIL